MSWLNDAEITTAEDKQEAAAEAAEQEAKRIEREAKLTGFDFQGVMCSGHKEDQWGLDSITPLLEAGQSVPFHFKNGSVLLVTPENFAQFKTEWTNFRMGFFV
jgi:hypothetical protein